MTREEDASCKAESGVSAVGREPEWRDKMASSRAGNIGYFSAKRSRSFENGVSEESESERVGNGGKEDKRTVVVDIQEIFLYPMSDIRLTTN